MTFASLASLPLVVSSVAITAATMARRCPCQQRPPCQRGRCRGWRRRTTAPLQQRAPPQSRMADDDDDDNNGSARDVASPALSQPSRADDAHLPPPPSQQSSTPPPVAPPGGSSRPPVRSSDGSPPMRGSLGLLSKGIPSHCWRFFVSPIVLRVRPSLLPSFHPPSPRLLPSHHRLTASLASLHLYGIGNDDDPGS